MMPLVDVHCHLEHEWFKNDLDAVIARAKEAGVKTIVTAGINPETNRAALELTKKYDIVKCSLGIYPIDALETETKDLSFPLKIKPFSVDEELNFIEENKHKILAVGEIGMDLKTGKDEKNQRELFIKQLELASKIKKPAIIHSRGAEQQVIEVLESFKLKTIIHCFGGKISLAKKIKDNGWCFSIPPVITRLEHFQKIVDLAPITQLLTETDAPYLSPFKGERNEPSYVTETIKKISEIKKMTDIEVANSIYMNYQRLF